MAVTACVWVINAADRRAMIERSKVDGTSFNDQMRHCTCAEPEVIRADTGRRCYSIICNTWTTLDCTGFIAACAQLTKVTAGRCRHGQKDGEWCVDRAYPSTVAVKYGVTFYLYV